MKIIWKSSPNFDSNRKPVDKIICHWFGVGTLQSANTRFQKASEQVSSHYGISDSIVWQWVKEKDVAYHAGVYTINQRSIGIEHDATTEKSASDETYKTSGKLVREIADRYNIPLDRNHIIGHKEVRNTMCPGTIDIDRIISLAKGEKTLQEELNDCRFNRDSHWNDLVAINKALDLPDDSPVDTITKSIAGLKGRIQEVQTKLARAEIEVTNREEQVSRLEERLTENEKAHNTTRKGLENDLRVAIDQQEKYKKLFDTCSKDKGKLAIDLAECQSTNKIPLSRTECLLKLLLFWRWFK